MSAEALARALGASLCGRVTTNRRLAPLTTYRLGGPARVVAELADEQDARALARKEDRGGASVADRLARRLPGSHHDGDLPLEPRHGVSLAAASAAELCEWRMRGMPR